MGNRTDMKKPRTLAECEAVIAKGLEAYVEVGNALLEINDHRLYKPKWKTFEDYVRERWNLERNYAYRIMDAATTAKVLLPMGNKVPVPKNERVARELAPLRNDPALMRQVW